MAQYHVVTMFCIEHYLALIAACMPTLGPFFRHLRPSRLKRVVKGHKFLGDDAEGVWSRPGTLDHSLMYGSVLVSEARDKEVPFETAMPSHLPKAYAPRAARNMQALYVSENDNLQPPIELQETGSR
ncbi:MAG: hypothetical protein Q9191_003453 [Dirinaria sp. TL-2023a]